MYNIDDIKYCDYEIPNPEKINIFVFSKNIAKKSGISKTTLHNVASMVVSKIHRKIEHENDIINSDMMIFKGYIHEYNRSKKYISEEIKDIIVDIKSICLKNNEWIYNKHDDDICSDEKIYIYNFNKIDKIILSNNLEKKSKLFVNKKFKEMEIKIKNIFKIDEIIEDCAIYFFKRMKFIKSRSELRVAKLASTIRKTGWCLSI